MSNMYRALVAFYKCQDDLDEWIENEGSDDDYPYMELYNLSKQQLNYFAGEVGNENNTRNEVL